MKEALAMAKKALLEENGRGRIDELSQEEVKALLTLQPSY
jgi:hypothetical protein